MRPMKYIDTGRVARDCAPRGPQSKHCENTLLNDCVAFGDRPPASEGKPTYFIAGAIAGQISCVDRLF